MQTLSSISVNVTIATLLAQVALKQETPLSVCELITNRAKYHRQMVNVRGDVYGGVHGAWLAAPPGCQYKLTTRGIEWANVIFLAYPSENPRNVDEYAAFRVDWQSIRRTEETVKHAGFNPAVDHTVKTYRGMFITYLDEDLDKRVNPDIPGAFKLGFGPVGLEAPAQLLIRTVRDAVVIRGRDPRDK